MRKARKLRVCVFCGNSRPCDNICWFKVGKGNGLKVFACQKCRGEINARQVAVEALVGYMRGVNSYHGATQLEHNVR